jgi:uncharacterized protein DUF3310
MKYRYDEDEILKEIKKYVDTTYKAHYAGDDSVQAIDLIKSGGMLMHFAASSIIKYAFRFGKKNGPNRKDLLKIVHYAMFMMWALDDEKKEPETELTREQQLLLEIDTTTQPYSPGEVVIPKYKIIEK